MTGINYYLARKGTFREACVGKVCFLKYVTAVSRQLLHDIKACYVCDVIVFGPALDING